MERTIISAVAPLLALVFAAPLAAQDPDTTTLPSGVRLGMIYETGYRPKIAVRPVEAGPGERGVAEQIGGVLTQDLDYSDRFEMGQVPPSLAFGPVNYEAWNDLGVVYLVTGGLQRSGRGYRLRITVHDVVYGEVDRIQSFELPGRGDPNFRMAVHAVSDRIVEWTTGEPGMAASRIAFVQRQADGGRALMVVDYDGENLRRLVSSDHALLSPAWSPDGRRIAFSQQEEEGHWTIREYGLESEQLRVLVDGGTHTTPAYSPDGRRLAYASTTGGGSWALFELDASRACCSERLTGSRRADLSPTYSPDGRLIAFNSDRLGQPHIYVQRRGASDPELLSPFVYGEPGHYTSPDWSPTNSLVVFHGGSPGRYQIMVADADDPGAVVRQLTQGGSNEDPSWAPDGRHVAFSGARDDGRGLYVMDAVTGRERLVVRGDGIVVPDWSPSLAGPSAEFTGGR